MEKVERILRKANMALSRVRGVVAIALGGSRAHGTHTQDSDIDIGIYYDADALDLSMLDAAASILDDEGRRGLIAAPGAWGEWVNGGGWLVVDGMHTDLILRDAARVARVVSESGQGLVTSHYQTGHPHAFLSVIYRGELATCRLLWDGEGRMRALQDVARPYPPALRDALVGFFTFEANFSYTFAEKQRDASDPYYFSAQLMRAVSALNQVLFAKNETYCLNEKRAVAMADGFALRPDKYARRVGALFANAGVDNARALLLLRGLIDETEALACRPKI